MNMKKWIGYKAGLAYYRDPAFEAPPRGVKLIILNKGGVAILSDWEDGLGHQKWSLLPKNDGVAAICAEMAELLSAGAKTHAIKLFDFTPADYRLMQLISAYRELHHVESAA